MRLAGTLRSWNDGRGFGFIAPTHGGAELFVHISALPSDGSRPTVGEKLTYELGRGKNGQAQATKVQREAVGQYAGRLPVHRRRSRQGRPFASRVLVLIILLALGSFGFDQYRKRTAAVFSAPAAMPAALPAKAPSARPATTAQSFKCDGRTYCSQMTSCAEATFFLGNCPGTKMDGNHDGTPCEQQWCTGPFAK